ncbi:MAG: methyltransferase domain-containing protein [Proteobacteria bacterium]|nr:methyltransferase domain-containing protein [Pseudomonadota bacterium]
MDAATHYNQITDAWKVFMGDNFHFGYFETDDIPLSQATDMLIEKMLALSPATPEKNILDVGCGIGNPAFYIHETYNCQITGISTSERGVGIANAASTEKGYQDSVRFKVRDALDNGFPDNQFDIVWVMESSHLMPNKKKLFSECYRVLKKDGVMVLCDLMLMKLLPFHQQLVRNIREFKNYLKLLKAWGGSYVVSPGFYCNGILAAGFNDVKLINISKQTFPTLRWWKKNALEFKQQSPQNTSMKEVDAFIEGTKLVEKNYLDGFAGYGMLKAVKK